MISSATDAVAPALSRDSCWQNSAVGHCREKISWMSAAGLGSLVLNSLAPGSQRYTRGSVACLFGRRADGD